MSLGFLIDVDNEEEGDVYHSSKVGTGEDENDTGHSAFTIAEDSTKPSSFGGAKNATGPNVIILATNEIVGHGKGISNISSKLIVKKNGVPDLTMVDFPRITRVAVLGQTEDMLEQISGFIMLRIIPPDKRTRLPSQMTREDNMRNIVKDEKIASKVSADDKTKIEDTIEQAI
ncbi:putative dynamin-related protein 4A [Capsicum baccatum]|uniref:Dynamin-related protein 4A n=1 Tax=Capsicum baccatum TaxID=33114 RepID=A0A2G2WTM9_CAPBA|nr:putative dynamin-related protein 4A [Capsicum baccatum]